MRSTPFVVALVVWAGLGLAQIGAAQTASRLAIHNVTLPDGAGVLTITGTGFGPNPAVTVDGQPVQLLPGATDTQVTVIAPSVLLTTPGTYRLTVVDSVRQVGEAFVVTSHPESVVPVGGAPSGTPSAATGSATRVAAPPATGLAGITAPQPLDSVVTLTGFEDPGAPYRTAVGYQALFNNDPTTGFPSGYFNTATGFQALFANTTGVANTASGYQALYSNTTGGWNAASGYYALYNNTTGYDNTASGAQALLMNTTGSYNTASGNEALLYNTNGSYNTASGYNALFSNTTGRWNTASGAGALDLNTTGNYNTANGFQALNSDTTGSANTASGVDALLLNTGGSYNTASGIFALGQNTWGFGNTASGYNALLYNTNGSYNTALGTNAGFNATTGSYNVFLGAGVQGSASDTNTIRIGSAYDGTNGQNQTFIAGIYGTPVTNWLPVVIDASGKLGTINPQTGGGIPVPTASTTGAKDVTVVQLRQQVRDLQTTNADLQARVARLESLLSGTGAAGGK